MLMLNLLNRPWFHHLSPHRRNIPTLGTHKANQILTRQEQVGIPEKDLSRCRMSTSKQFTPKHFNGYPRGFGVNTEHQLQIVEQCAHGVQRNRRPEFFFHGILGHVKDWYGQPIDTWTNANKISNYWRRFYEIPEVPYEESGTWEQPNVLCPRPILGTQ